MEFGALFSTLNNEGQTPVIPIPDLSSSTFIRISSTLFLNRLLRLLPCSSCHLSTCYHLKIYFHQLAFALCEVNISPSRNYFSKNSLVSLVPVDTPLTTPSSTKLTGTRNHLRMKVTNCDHVLVPLIVTVRHRRPPIRRRPSLPNPTILRRVEPLPDHFALFQLDNHLRHSLSK